MRRAMIAATGLALMIALIAIYFFTGQRAGHDHARMQLRMHPDRAFLHGAPADPSEPWTLSAGGRIYDNWWEALRRPEPNGNHPAYPAAGKSHGVNTWRCKECHGWDYKGRDGQYARGSHATGVIGIRGAQARDPKEIAALLRAPPHNYSVTMINDEELLRLAAFVSRGQLDVDKHIGARGGDVQVSGSTANAVLERGRAIYQATCAACHGFDGRRLNFGTAAKVAYIGSEAIENPWEVMHKVFNGHPGAEMINLRPFGTEDAAAVLSYARTLPKN